MLLIVSVLGTAESALTQPRLVYPSPLSAAEEQAVAACLCLVRGCQLPDGAFAQVRPGSSAHAPVWIAPYFANYAALALLAGQAHAQGLEDLSWVG